MIGSQRVETARWLENYLQISRESIARMNSRSAVECSPVMEVPSGILPKVKNNFSIDHLLAKSDPVPDRFVNFVSGSSRFDSNCGFVSPDSSSCGTAYNVDYLDNASEGPSEESFDNGEGNSVCWEINDCSLFKVENSTTSTISSTFPLLDN